ncbi:Golgi complex component 7-domain-containing protein [Coprinopsis sp. MPI-PUGE-AT-0042]|nr:Golgi complex component 7-domain-containing protein [Coprinopsis sp. MPI-PUGE-AT-0042]
MSVLSSSTTKLTDSLEQYDDVTAWINDELNAQDENGNISNPSDADLTKLDQYITQLLTTLDIACEDTSAQLERIIDDVSRGIPRLAYDLHFMKDGALTLQSSLVEVLKKSKDAVPPETSEALDNLHQLDLMKGRMEAAREVLQEAESWSTLEMEVTALIAERSYAKAAERLSEASKSMVVFQNTPEYDPRRALMVNLQNQLEASLSSALVSAINSQDVTACKEYFSIFSTIQRESEFRNYYNAARRASVIHLWQSANLTDCDTSEKSTTGSQQSFAEFLPRFYSAFLALLNAERSPISSIFPDPLATLSQFISSTISALQPTFSQRLSSYVNHHGEGSLPHLITVLRATEEFGTGVWKVMEKLQDSDASKPRVASPTMERPSGHRRRSSRMSISWRPGQPRPAALSFGGRSSGSEHIEWDQELFQPFLDLQVDYASLERKFLDFSFVEIISNDSRDSNQEQDKARLFRERAVDIVGVAEGSAARCKSFTHGYGSVGLVQAVDGFFAAFVDTWTAELAGQPSGSQSYGFSATELDLADLDYSAKDWSQIQLMLHMLGSGRVVLDRFNTFETKLRSFLAQIGSSFRQAQVDPLNFNLAATKGETQLLEQSTLNSLELFSLLSSTDDTAYRETPLTAPLSATPLTATFRQPQQPPVPEALFVQTRKALSNFAQTCQITMQNTVLSPLHHHLSTYAYLAIWSTREDPQSALAADLNIPTFSLSPSETVQRVAEGLLNLPRLFEVYADDDALGFSLQTLPHVDPELLKAAEQHLEPQPSGPGHHRRASISFAKPTPIDPEVVSSAWLVSLGHTFLEHLTSDILPLVTPLTSAGAAQLSSDLEYLTNIVRALNVESEVLDKWRQAAGASEKEVKKEIQQNSADPVLIKVARARGWN